MIAITDMTMQFGKKPLFENVSIKFSTGQRYGLIGANGCGKSTLIKILSGELEPSSGSVSLDRNERIAQLRQDQFAFETHTVLDTIIMGHTELWNVKQERERIYAFENMSAEDGMKVAELEVRFGELDGYSAESQAGELLLGIGVPLKQHGRLMSEVEPGLKLRILLAQALFFKPDILLLDEPTNNLDINTIRWLENIIKGRKSTIIIVSHDRHFLNSTCTHIVDMDYGEARVYPGNYDDYMIASTQARERMLANNTKKKAQIAELKTFVSRFSANASKARQATSRVKQIEKIKLEDVKPSSRVSPYIRFEQGKQLYRLALEVKGLSKSFSTENIFSNVKLNIEVGERVAVIGANGIGKTTLLRCLIGDLQIDNGDVKWSENAEIGYFPQDHTDCFAEKMSLLDWMSQWVQAMDDEQFLRSILGQLLFSGNDIQKSVSVLSGGEQGRMLFGKLMIQKPNILLMDEPTNNLDMGSIESLNLALEHYQGTLIFISHDREFVSSLATRIIEITQQGIIDFNGSYDEYLYSQGIEVVDKTA